MKFKVLGFLDESIAPLSETLELCLWTPWIKGGRTVSLLIIGNPELGATTVMAAYRNIVGVRYTDVVTPYGIVENFGEDLQRQTINHLLFPDVGALSGSYTAGSTQKNVSFMKSLIEEGITNMSIYYIHNFPAVQKGFRDGLQMRCGIITKIQTAVWEDARNHWRRSGFASRLHPFSMHYSEYGMSEIINSVTQRLEQKVRLISLELPSMADRSSYEVTIPEEIRKSLVELSLKIRDTISEKEKEREEFGYGFRTTESVKTLLQAITLKREYESGNKSKKLVVSKEDWELCRILSYWWNYSSHKSARLDNVEKV
jgi:hypothetical protein